MWKKSSKTKEPENVDSAYDYAVFLLSLHLRTVGEVLNKMKDRGYTGQVIEQVVEQLKQQGYLNDQRYAEIFLENLKLYRNFGYYGIKKKMMEKKLPMALIESVLEEGLSKDEEIKIAERLLKKEGLSVKPKSDDGGIRYQTYNEESSKAKQKLAQKLKTKGFRGDVIARLVF
jgi:regulatory protein